MTAGRSPPFFKKPKGCSVVKNYHQLDYSHLEKSFTIINQEIESKCNEEETEDCANAHSEDTETYQDDSEEKTVEVDSETAQDPQAEMSGRNWKISKSVDGNLTYIHIMQALKLLLPHEYTSLLPKQALGITVSPWKGTFESKA